MQSRSLSIPGQAVRECRVTLIDEREDAECRDCTSVGRDLVVPGLGRFNSVVERRSCSKCLKEFLVTLPWSIMLVAAAQIVLEFCCGRDASFDLSLRSSSGEAEFDDLEYQKEENLLRSYLRYFSYMLVHESQSHLWSNVATEITLAWFASAATTTRRGFTGQLELILVYLLSGFCGGLAFKAVTSGLESDVGLVGGSAGVFGLAGLCFVDSIADLSGMLAHKWKKMRNSSYANLEAVITPSRSSTTRILLLVSRSSAALVIVGFDIYSAVFRDGGFSHNKDVFSVHLGGLAAGVALSASLVVFKAVWQWVREFNGRKFENRRRFVVSLLKEEKAHFGEENKGMFVEDV